LARAGPPRSTKAVVVALTSYAAGKQRQSDK
jgi:hypothetical protein